MPRGDVLPFRIAWAFPHHERKGVLGMTTPPAPGASLSSPPAVITRPIIKRLRAAGCVFAEEEARPAGRGRRATPDAPRCARGAAGLRRAARARRWAGRSSAGCGSRWTPECSCRAAAPSSWSEPRGSSRPGAGRAPVVVDLCCGSGRAGGRAAAALPGPSSCTPPTSTRRRRVVRTSQHRAARRRRCTQGDLYAPLPARLRGRVDVLAVNAPYVPTGRHRRPCRRRPALHEPRVTLDGGADGPRRAAAGGGRGAAVAGPGRPPADRDERGGRRRRPWISSSAAG